MRRPLTIGLRWAIVLAYAWCIFRASTLTPADLPGQITAYLFPGADKIIHFMEYAVFCFLICRAVDVSMSGGMGPGSNRLRTALLICFLCASLYGLSDEIHQLYMPTRSCDVLDLLADTLGAGVAALMWPASTACFPLLRT